MCPCPDFNCASCLGIASPIAGTDKMEVEFGDEKKQRENTHQEGSIEVMKTCVRSVMFHAADTWTMPVTTLNHIQCHGKQWSI